MYLVTFHLKHSLAQVWFETHKISLHAQSMIIAEVADVSEVACRRCHESCIFQRCVWGLGGTLPVSHTADCWAHFVPQLLLQFYNFSVCWAANRQGDASRDLPSRPDMARSLEYL